MRSRPGAVALTLSALLLVTGCASLDGAPAPSSDAPAVFEGTPAEFSVLMRSCLEEQGIATYDMAETNDPTGYMVSAEVPREQFQAAREQCSAQIGEPQMRGLPDDELQRRYDARTEQWACLIDLGLVSGDAPSFEVFVDEYDRSGQILLWEPTEGASTVGANGQPISPSDVCARSGDVW